MNGFSVPVWGVAASAAWPLGPPLGLPWVGRRSRGVPLGGGVFFDPMWWFSRAWNSRVGIVASDNSIEQMSK